MCARNCLRSTGGTRNSHHQGRNGHRVISSDAGGEPFRGHQAAEEDNMKISVRDAGAAKVVEIEGDVDLGSSPDLRRPLFETLLQAPKLALNLAAIRYIDSSGIATLLEVLRDSQRRNKEFVLFGLSPAVQQVFHLTHVVRIFQVFQTEEEALGSA